jgi:serine/threonine-protein kinase HipA
MSTELHAWANGRHVAVFHNSDEGHVGLEYDADAPQYPLSISLPRDGGWKDEAPAAFLDNLLPDEPSARDVMADSLHAKSTSTFDLLDGVDATGGLVFSQSDVNPFTTQPLYSPMDESDIVERIRQIRRYGAAWWSNDPHCRYSLAGHQGKFTATRLGGQWFWPNASVPSTHIFKPEPANSPHAADNELAMMNLAELCGLNVPKRANIIFHDAAQDERSYVVARFDRIVADGRIMRLRCEDMLQSMGLGPAVKYDPQAKDCLKLLNTVDASHELAYQWIERLAFNAHTGNCDAHAKNYSLMLGETVTLAPVYDVVCTRFWPRYDQEMAMSIGGERFAENVTPAHWEHLALDNSLDTDRVAAIVSRISKAIYTHMDEAVQDIPVTVADRLREQWEKANRNL